MEDKCRYEHELIGHMYRQNGFAFSPEHILAYLSRDSIHIYSANRYVISSMVTTHDNVNIVKLPNPDYNYPANIDFKSKLNENFHSNLDFFSELCNRHVFMPLNSYGNGYVNQGRHLVWSPMGVDANGKSVLGLVNMDGDVHFFRDNSTFEFDAFVSPRNKWLTYLFKNGRHSRELKNTRMAKKGLDEAAIQMNAKNAISAIEFLEDFKFIGLEFYPNLIEIEKESNLIFVTLSKSGMIAFWRSNLPMVTCSQLSVLLSETDDCRIHEKEVAKKANKLIDLKIFNAKGNLLMLKIYSNGEVWLVAYKVEVIKKELKIEIIDKSSLIPKPIKLVTVNTVHFDEEHIVMFFSYNRFLVRVNLDEKALKPTVKISEIPDLTLNITGIKTILDEIFVVAQDGFIIKSKLESDLTDWQCILDAEQMDQYKLCLWQFFGLYGPSSGTYLNFIIEPDNFLECNASFVRSRIPSKLVRYSLKSDEQLLSDISDTLESKSDHSPLRLDLISELHNRITLYKKKESHLLGQINGYIQTTLEKVEKMRLTALVKSRIDILQVYWYFNQLLSMQSDEKTNMELLRKRIEYAITINRNINALKIFTKDEIQINAGDCRLILGLAFILYSLKDVKGSNYFYKDLTKSLKDEINKLAEETFHKAEVMIRKVFKKGNESSLKDKNPCPSCQEDCEADITQILCSNGHKFPRCPQTSVVLTKKVFSSCQQCSQEYLAEEYGKPSAWHFRVRNQHCSFCHLPLSSYLE